MADEFYKMFKTTDYRKFKHAAINRPVNLMKHKKLIACMQEYGFLRSFPISIFRMPDGTMIVKDGQHRLAIAEKLGLPVWWVEEVVDFKISKINETSKIWTLQEHAEAHAEAGIKSYVALLEFSKRHKIGVSLSACLLAGTTSFGNFDNQFYCGQFKIKEQAFAESVAALYGAFVAANRNVKGSRLAEALIAVCRIPEFDAARLLNGLNLYPEANKQFATRDGFLEMLELLYNYKKKTLFALKTNAIQVMRDRNAVVASVKRKREKEVAAH